MIVTVEQLRDYMSGIGLNADQAQGAEDILVGVQAELERYLRRPLELTTVTEPIEISPSGYIATTVSPIVSVATSGYYVTAGQIRPLYTLSGIGFGDPTTITYTGGYDGLSPAFADVRLAILRVAAREVEQRHDDTRSVKDLSTRNEGEMQLRQRVGWLPEELTKFDSLRLRVTWP